VTTAAPTLPVPDVRDASPHVVSDALTITWRNLLNLRRNPRLLVFATIQPVVFVLMFTYVFGGAIKIPGVPYIDYLMPGIFVQTITFGALNTGVGLADDLKKGLIERFRSLPMARSAVLSGRTLADLFRNVFVVLLMCVVGFAVGWRISTDFAGLLAALLLLLAFAYSLSWMFGVVGLFSPDGETAQAVSFPILAPLVFASSAFVRPATMPSWLQGFAEHQPVSVVVDAVRALTLGGPTASKVMAAIVWIVAIVAIFAPLAIIRYRRVT
jgi:ABC transporter DrrB family efflux protein